MSAVRVYVPRDSAALALGADELAAALVEQAALRGLTIELVRNGSRGMFCSNHCWRCKPRSGALLMARLRLRMCRVCLMPIC